jgi:hypothetical protein
MKTLIAALLLTVGMATPSPWVLVCNHHGLQKKRMFSDKPEAIRWIESHRAYTAIVLTHEKVVRPCHTREDDGSSAHSRLVICVTREEFDKSFDANLDSRGNTY